MILQICRRLRCGDDEFRPTVVLMEFGPYAFPGIRIAAAAISSTDIISFRLNIHDRLYFTLLFARIEYNIVYFYACSQGRFMGYWWYYSVLYLTPVNMGRFLAVVLCGNILFTRNTTQDIYYKLFS